MRTRSLDSQKSPRRERRNDLGKEAESSSMDEAIRYTQEAIKKAFVLKKKVRGRLKETRMLDAQA